MPNGFIPWTQQPALPPRAEEKAPPEPKKNWWEQGLERWQETGGVTMPWQTEHWEAQPAWTRHLGKAALGVGLTSAGAALGLSTPAILAYLSSHFPWLTGPALFTMDHTTALKVLGGAAGLMTSAYMAPGEAGAPAPTAPPGVPTPTAPAAPAAPTAPPILPTPGVPEAAGPAGQPEVMEIGGQTFWWNPTGGIYGTGGWDLIPPRAEPRAPSLTPEQQMAESEAQRAAQMERLQMQYQLEQQLMGGQQQAARGLQEAGAAQQMAQMYAADPYKYWAQMGTPTPEAVARLTGGEVGPGEPFQQGVPLSMPSQQWWGNLLPSEQQQIMGGLNWMGMDPQDWFAMKQRMIPGLGARQMGPVWAR